MTKLKAFGTMLVVPLAAVLLFTTHRVHAQPSAQRIEIIAKRFEFSPGDITVKKGVPVTLVLTSRDVDHGLKFKDLNVAINVKRGQTKEVTFTPGNAGTFIGQCSVFCGSGHGAMKMTLHVT